MLISLLAKWWSQGCQGLKNQNCFWARGHQSRWDTSSEKLGKIIFADDNKRELLNRSLGPFIRKEILRQIEVMKAKADLVIVDIPLLYETGYESLLDQVAVVYLPESIQLQRLMKRDHLTSIEAQQRINSQMPIEEKRKRADILFDNQGTIEEVKTQVQEWLAKRKN